MDVKLKMCGQMDVPKLERSMKAPLDDMWARAKEANVTQALQQAADNCDMARPSDGVPKEPRQQFTSKGTAAVVKRSGLSCPCTGVVCCTKSLKIQRDTVRDLGVESREASIVSLAESRSTSALDDGIVLQAQGQQTGSPDFRHNNWWSVITPLGQNRRGERLVASQR